MTKADLLAKLAALPDNVEIFIEDDVEDGGNFYVIDRVTVVEAYGDKPAFASITFCDALCEATGPQPLDELIHDLHNGN